MDSVTNVKQLTKSLSDLCIFLHTELTVIDAQMDESRADLDEILDMSAFDCLEFLSDQITKLVSINAKLVQTPRMSDIKHQQRYEAALQKLEGEVRNHIHVEQKMKLHIDSMQQTITDLDRQVGELTDNLEDVSKRMNQAELSAGSYERQLDEAREQVRTLVHQNRALERQLDVVGTPGADARRSRTPTTEKRAKTPMPMLLNPTENTVPSLSDLLRKYDQRARDKLAATQTYTPLRILGNLTTSSKSMIKLKSGATSATSRTSRSPGQIPTMTERSRIVKRLKRRAA